MMLTNASYGMTARRAATMARTAFAPFPGTLPGGCRPGKNRVTLDKPA